MAREKLLIEIDKSKLLTKKEEKLKDKKEKKEKKSKKQKKEKKHKKKKSDKEKKRKASDYSSSYDKANKRQKLDVHSSDTKYSFTDTPFKFEMIKEKPFVKPRSIISMDSA